MLIGILGGRIQDFRFAQVKRSLDFQPKHPRDLDGFPIERTRTTYFPYYFPIFLAAVIGYGWALDKTSSVAIPLVLSFIIGSSAQFSHQMSQLLLVDFFPTNAGASAGSVSRPMRGS